MGRCAQCAVLLLVLGMVWRGRADEISSGADTSLRKFVERFELGSHHVGVGYNVLRGAETTQHIFANVEYDIDPLVHHSVSEVHQLDTLRQLHETYAHRAHLDFLRGMFVHAPPPAYVPDDDTDELCFLAIRSEELLAVRLKARTALAPALAADLAALPDRYDAADVDLWDGFFARHATHWTESAFIGGTITVSSAVHTGSNVSPVRVRRFLDQLLHSGVVDAANAELVGSGSHYIRTTGGDNTLIKTRIVDNATMGAHWAQWVHSLQSRPTISRFTVKSVAELAATPARRVAIAAAIEHHLLRAYEEWRAARVAHNADLKMLTDIERTLRGEVSQLSQKLVEVSRLVKEKTALVEECEKDEAAVDTAITACHAEQKSYQTAIIRCDMRNYQFEEAEKRFKECELKRRTDGCPSMREAARL